MSRERCEHEAARWLAQARADLRAAAASTGSGSHEWACFQAQQAAEKALKALWFAHGFEPWGHSVLKLIEDLPDPELRGDLSPLEAHARRLDRLYIPTRYPNGLPELTPAEAFGPEDAREAISAAQAIIDQVENRRA